MELQENHGISKKVRGRMVEGRAFGGGETSHCSIIFTESSSLRSAIFSPKAYCETKKNLVSRNFLSQIT